MEKYYGFDLGDAECAVSCLQKGEKIPQILSVGDAKSFISAYALLKNGDLLIGENACYAENAVKRKLRFKSRFLTETDAQQDIRAFAGGVLGELYGSGNLVKNDEVCFYAGCPAGWNKTVRETYRRIFEEVGYPPVRIISESRAALVSACQSKYLQVGYDILSKPVLVVDMGSSTTDFAYINGGREEELKTTGEVFLGGGIMDEILLEESLKSSPEEKKIRKIFAESEAWKTYCEFACRRLKERYFSDEQYWKGNDCRQTVSIRYGMFPVKLTIRMNETIAGKLLNDKSERIQGRSFRKVFLESLESVRDSIHEKQPELLFLTGGVSKLPAIRAMCQEVFPDAVIISGTDPEFAVASGLAYCGSIDEELKAFRKDIEDLVSGSQVERLVEKHINELYRAVVDALVDPILQDVAMPVIDAWRNGGIEKLCEIDERLKAEIENYLHSEKARRLLLKPISAWLKPIAYELEEYTVPICLKHNVPYSALNLNSYLQLGDVDIQVDARNVFAVEEITWMIDTLISILVGLLCGGSGVAIISTGPSGIFAGAMISLVVLALGKNKMQKAVLNANLPKIVRKMASKSYINARLETVSEEVKESLYRDLEKEKNEEISQRLVQDISAQIDECLTSMAEVVEIPLGE